jgi:hypothetical protein
VRRDRPRNARDPSRHAELGAGGARGDDHHPARLVEQAREGTAPGGAVALRDSRQLIGVDDQGQRVAEETLAPQGDDGRLERPGLVGDATELEGDDRPAAGPRRGGDRGAPPAAERTLHEDDGIALAVEERAQASQRGGLGLVVQEARRDVERAADEPVGPVDAGEERGQPR